MLSDRCKVGTVTHSMTPVDLDLWVSGEKLARFDSFQVYFEIPCFKRQKADRAVNSCVT